MQANCESTTKDLSIDTTNDERNLVDVNNLVLNVSYDWPSNPDIDHISERDRTFQWHLGVGHGQWTRLKFH